MAISDIVLAARRCAALAACLALAAALLHGASMQYAAAAPEGAQSFRAHMMPQTPGHAGHRAADADKEDCPLDAPAQDYPPGAMPNCPLGFISAVTPAPPGAFSRAFLQTRFDLAGERAPAAVDLILPDPPPRG